MKRAPRVGQVVVITLRDHGLGGNVPLLFDVYGRVREVTPHEILVDYWHYSPDGDVDPAAKDDNCEFARVVRGAIVRWRALA